MPSATKSNKVAQPAAKPATETKACLLRSRGYCAKGSLTLHCSTKPSCHLHMYGVVGKSKTALATEILLFFFVGQPDVCGKGAIRCATKGVAGRDRGMNIGIFVFQSLWLPTGFTARRCHFWRSSLL
jgi:hypothetical protein